MAGADDEKFNYDEARAPAYTLPDPLKMQDGRPVIAAAAWRDERRGELLRLFETHVYGQRPPTSQALRAQVLETASAVHDKATRKRIQLSFSDSSETYPGFTITLFVPRGTKGPVPAFIGMHLFDSKAAEPVPGQHLAELESENLPGDRLMEVILERGYAIATLDANEFCPDDKQKFRDGVLSHLYPGRKGPPAAEEPGAIATWAWALSRTLDYLSEDSDVDARRVAVIGHSRMGKTALWAGAEDPRFALVISNNSGCGGAALSRRDFGETVARITRVFPHWFCGNFSKYAHHEDQLPIDQHELVALIAPRPVYIASAQDDGWADPRGAFLSALGADPVYRLLGEKGLQTADFPAVGITIGQTIGYHIRVGKHALTDYDWMKYLDFADRWLRRSDSKTSAPGN